MTDFLYFTYELLIFSAIFAGGVAIAFILGVSNTWDLIVSGFGVAIALRVLSSLSLWAIGYHGNGLETWLALLALGVLALLIVRGRSSTQAIRPVFLGIGLSLTALTSKYVFGFGEMEHSDSVSVLRLAIISIQGEPQIEEHIASSYKRGIAYPLMLSLGPEGRILGGFTPLIFIMTVLLFVRITALIVAKEERNRSLILSLIAVAALMISTPIIRVSAFYLNGHTLLGFGVLVMILGYILLRQGTNYRPSLALLFGVGGIITVTSRSEGILFASIVLSFVASEINFDSRRSRVGIASLMLAISWSLPFWISSAGSEMLSRVGIPLWSIWLLPALAIPLLFLPLLDEIRKRLPLVIGGLLIGYFLKLLWDSRDPLALLSPQISNLVFGEGGWAALPGLLAILSIAVLLGKNAEEKKLIAIGALLFIGTFLAKTLDGGGFGRSGFYDSVNRMMLQSVWVFAIVVASKLSFQLNQVIGLFRLESKHRRSL